VFAAKSIAADHFGVSFDVPTPRTYCRQRGRVTDLSAHMAAPPIHSHFHHIHIFGIWNGLKHMFPFTMAISLQSVVFISMTIGAFIVVSILKVSPVFASWIYFTTQPNKTPNAKPIGRVSTLASGCWLLDIVGAACVRFYVRRLAHRHCD
jgi:hypothetical protein